jgi:drug/metabolite transporter (DMT)-like permease
VRLKYLEALRDTMLAWAQLRPVPEIIGHGSPSLTMHAGRVRGPTKGVLCALGAALLFGLSTPLAKRLLPSADPWLLAGLLYLGSGLGLSIYRLATTIRRSPAAAETPLGRADLPWLTMAIFFGGIVGPVLLMLGLRITPASSASLLLNLEGVFTALLAWFAFRENFDARIAWGMALISAGALTLSWQGRPMVGPAWGSAAIAGACLCWALDNNLTRKVSASDPVQIALVKGWCAGAVNTALGLVVGAQVPTSGILLTAGLVGFVGYGVSLALFVVALRELGTARTGAYFSLAPFVGGAMAVILFGDGPAGAVHDGLGLGTLGGALDGDVPDGVVGEVVHHRPDPGRGVRSPAPGQGRGLVDADVLLAPLPRGPAVGRFAGAAEAFDEGMSGDSHTLAGTLSLTRPRWRRPGRQVDLPAGRRQTASRPVLGLPRGGLAARLDTKMPLGASEGRRGGEGQITSSTGTSSNTRA